MDHIIIGDCREVMAGMDAGSVDAIVTDPPYGIGFMGKQWDAPSMLGQVNRETGRERQSGGLHRGPGTNSRGYADNDSKMFQAWSETWAREALRVLKPGGYLLAFGGTRTYHRMVCAIEDAGFEIRDSILYWGFGQGFPKSHNVSKRLRDQGLCCTCTDSAVQYNHDNHSPTLLPRVPETLAEDAAEPCTSVLLNDVHGVGAAAVSAGPNLRGVRLAMDGGDQGPGEEQDLFSGMQQETNQSGQQGRQACADQDGNLPDVRSGFCDPGVPGQPSAEVLFAPMQWQGEGEKPNPLLGQRSGEETSGQGTERRDQPCVEGRRHLLQNSRQLYGSEVHPVPTAVPPDGASGWLRDGASAPDGGASGVSVDADGGGASPGPRPAKQRSRQPRTVANERQPQGVRAWPDCPRCGLPMVPDGLGTALKPAYEPICVARKPFRGTVAANVLAHGTGGLNIDGCRIGTGDNLNGGAYAQSGTDRHDGYDDWRFKRLGDAGEYVQPPGRWPANVILSHHESCRPDGVRRVKGSRIDTPCASTGMASGYSGGLGGARPARGIGDADGMETFEAWDCARDESGAFICPVAMLDAQSGERKSGRLKGTYKGGGTKGIYGEYGDAAKNYDANTGGASRFFYVAKAPASERLSSENGTRHPTQKPVALMRWLVRLVTPPGGLVLDMFAGSGSTGVACVHEGFRFVGIEQDSEYSEIAIRRIAHARGPLFASVSGVPIDTHNGGE